MPKYLMNPNTGSVDTEESWREEMPGWEETEPDNDSFVSREDQFAELIEVKLANDEEVPEDFNPCDSWKYNWIAVD